jgi:hypothetical protein
MIAMDEHFARLIKAERLDDLDTLLTPRSWDEVPLWSRLHRIEFLSGDVREKSRALVVNAVRYLDHIMKFVAQLNREDIVVMVSILDWGGLESPDSDPLRPKYWMIWYPERELANFRLKSGSSKEARVVIEWLRDADLLLTHDVFDSVKIPEDPDLFRVYVAQSCGTTRDVARRSEATLRGGRPPRCFGAMVPLSSRHGRGGHTYLGPRP